MREKQEKKKKKSVEDEVLTLRASADLFIVQSYKDVGPIRGICKGERRLVPFSH